MTQRTLKSLEIYASTIARAKLYLQNLLITRSKELSNDDQIVLGEIYDNLEMSCYLMENFVLRGKEDVETEKSETEMELTRIHAGFFDR